MRNRLNLIVMLTHNDKTVNNAYEIFDRCRDSKALFWGFKEEPISFEESKKLYKYMKDCGKKTVLEVVAYSEEEGLKGAERAAACGCDILMGTKYSDPINDFCKAHGLKYMPFIGTVTGRPSVLEGTIDGMISEAEALLKKGVYGFDLLGYRFTGDAAELNRTFVSRIDAPVCIAGSVNSFERLDELMAAGPWAFTIGGAFFEKKFGDDFAWQINTVCDYTEKNKD